MANNWKLPADLVSALDHVRTTLDEEISDLRSRWDEQSERWQEGDRGITVAAWLDGLDLVAEAIEGAEDKPES